MHACGRPVEWDSWAAPVALTRNAGSAETLETVGPDAPTNVDGWTAHDIAAHVVSLDRFAGVPTYLGRILVARGVRLNDLARRASQLTQRAIDAEKRRGLGETIARLRQPSPPLLLRAPVRAVGLFEVWAHEDVRRANAIERDDHPALDEVIASLRRYSRIDGVPKDEVTKAAAVLALMVTADQPSKRRVVGAALVSNYSAAATSTCSPRHIAPAVACGLLAAYVVVVATNSASHSHLQRSGNGPVWTRRTACQRRRAARTVVTPRAPPSCARRPAPIRVHVHRAPRRRARGSHPPRDEASRQR